MNEQKMNVLNLKTSPKAFDAGLITPFRVFNTNGAETDPAHEENILLSIVLPVHNEEDNLERLYDEIMHVMTEYMYDYEIVFVDDGSNDGSSEVLKTLVEKNYRVSKRRFTPIFSARG